MVQNKKKVVGRPRQFDEADALEKAMEVFWECGFASASMEDLGSAMGMNRPSIYAAFGDKNELFVKVLQKYESEGRKSIEQLFNPQSKLEASLRNFFVSLLKRFGVGEKPPRGCLLTTVAITEAANMPAIMEFVAQAGQGLEAAFRSRFELAIKNGEITRTANASELAILASGLVYTLSARARTGDSKKVLDQVIDSFLIAMLGRKPRTKTTK